MRTRHITLIGAALALGLVAPAYADDFDVDTSGPNTVHQPYQPPDNSQSQDETPTHTILVPTWPVQVPVNVPDNVDEPPDQQHPPENEGAAEMGKHMEEQQAEPSPEVP